MAWVYILKSLRTGKYYIGSTSNYLQRFRADTSGRVRSTKWQRSVKLVLYQEYESLRRARKIEYRLKNYKRKDYLDKIVNDGRIKTGA